MTFDLHLDASSSNRSCRVDFKLNIDCCFHSASCHVLNVALSIDQSQSGIQLLDHDNILYNIL